MQDTQDSSADAADVASGLGAVALSVQEEDRPQHPSYEALPSNLEDEKMPTADAAADDTGQGDASAAASLKEPDQTIEVSSPACRLVPQK